MLRTRVLITSLATMLLVPVFTSGAVAAVSADRTSGSRPVTTKLTLPKGFDVSEPHLAIDPRNSKRLFTVAQALVGSDLTSEREFLWRSDDGGKTWTRGPALGGAGNGPNGASGDPTVAAGRSGLLLYGTLTFDFDAPADVAHQHVGTRVSTNGGATFSAFGSADEGTVPLCFFDGSCQGTPPPGLIFLDKPWLAVDGSNGRFRNRAYLIWVRMHFDTGRHELLFARSSDGGKTYSTPIRLDQSTDAALAGLEELAQLAVRPDGTVDAVWNGLRDGRPVVLHASSTNGGVSFGKAQVVTRLRPNASRLGIVTSLAVSARGQLGVCWSQAVSPDRYDARVACTVTDRKGRWSPGREILPGNRDRQYLPAATFQGDRLWAVAYVSNAKSTRLVAVARHGAGFGRPQTINAWPVPAARICGPHPPDCLDSQMFIGDYIGLVATPTRVMAAYIQPSARPPALNQLLFSSFS